MITPTIVPLGTLASALLYLIAGLAVGCSNPAAWPWYFGGTREAFR